MRTVVRSWRSSRATAVQTPRMTMLNKHHMTFISTVPRRSRSQMKKRGMATMRPGEVEDQQNQERLRDAGIEEGALDHAAFGRDVELAQPGIDERHHGGQQDVGREHGFVDLVPEGMAVLALDAGVGDVGKSEVRQRVGQDGGPEAGNVGVIQEQINQRRGEKDEARHRVEEMRHGVEVAEPLREA